MMDPRNFRFCFSIFVHLGIMTGTILAFSHPSMSLRQADCSTIAVMQGDGCATLVARCGISPSDFIKYNSDPTLCSSLVPGLRVCCTSGALPDTRPKPNSDGSCASYVVQSGDTCSVIAAAKGLKVADLAIFNDKTTWGWAGCDQLSAKLKICVSSGTPPMPQSVDNAVCGPLKPGSQISKDEQSIADLNPCPLNACCTIWGQCGITPEFCTDSKGTTGNPGTAPPGENGCISNCGTSIMNYQEKPSAALKIGYYESWNFDRPCMSMRADSVDVGSYTHYHWAFATITPTFDISINDTYRQWSSFLGLVGIKRVVSLGGWGFSTDPTTYDILRHAMAPENVDAFATNVVNFLTKNALDGVDFDWEYPGASDIPGIPPGHASDTINYLAFLKLLRAKLTNNKSLSIAAPASYWYLKQFPILEIADVVDYIVYMTYDLHGQWDYGNKFSQDGCAQGSCLRSHVNLTETMYSLAMITKAGVHTNKIAVGLSSYGRSFGMISDNCTGPTCSFGGPDSTAIPGECTGVPGYLSNTEISVIADLDEDGTKSWYDLDSGSNILVYGNRQWVSYMDDSTKSARTSLFTALNFSGTVDWALDLSYSGDDPNPNLEDDQEEFLPETVGLPDCDAAFGSIEDLDLAAATIPSNCKAIYTLQAINSSLATAMASYRDMMTHGYDDKFGTYASAVADSAGKSMDDFVQKHGNDYFTCVVGETQPCCAGCQGLNGNGEGDPCAYCFNGDCTKTIIDNKRRDEHDVSLSNYTDYLQERERPHPDHVPVFRYAMEAEPCPPDYSKRGLGPDHQQSVWWTLRTDQAEKFYNDVLANTGIAKSKIVLGNKDRGNLCGPGSTIGDGNSCWYSGYDFGIPMPSGYTATDVANPKDVVQKALANSDNFVQDLDLAVSQLMLDGYYGDELELVDSVSIPALMIINAVEDMQQVEQVADKIDEEKKKALILAFIGAILFFIPIAGEILGAVTEVANIAAILAVVAAAGDAALGIYQVVDDPSNPFLAILSIVLAPLALGDLAMVSKAANIRRGMSDEEILKLGGKIAGRMQTIKKVIGTCHKR